MDLTCYRIRICTDLPSIILNLKEMNKFNSKMLSGAEFTNRRLLI